MGYREIVLIAVFLVGFLGHAFYFKVFVTHGSPFWWSAYVQMQLYFVSFSLGLAFAYGAFSLASIRYVKAMPKSATGGSLILAVFVWATSCCGAPLLVSLTGILGIGVGAVVFPPPAVALLSIVLVSLGYLWLRKQRA